MANPQRTIRQVTGKNLLFVMCGVSLSFSAVLAVLWSRSWPLVGDASLMHYVVFLLQHGKAPYLEVADINLPGSYLLEALSMKLFGADAVGLRLYDGFLCLIACACMAALCKAGWQSRLFGLGSGLLLSLVHLQDGFGQAGQRDFAMAVIVLLAYVVLLRVERVPPALSLFFYELLIGFTVTIKPTLLPLVLVPLLLAGNGRYFRKSEDRTRQTLFALAGFCLPGIIAVGWLAYFGALEAFVRVFRSIGVIHAQMGRRPLAYLLGHCTSPLPVFFALWIVLAIMTRSYRDRESKVLLAGLLCGLGSYLIQGKGYPYQRYPFIAFFLLSLAKELPIALREKILPRYTAYAVLLAACLWSGPRFAHSVYTFRNAAPFQEILAADLQKRREQVSGGVQCLDTFGGCINVLYNMGIVQRTGFLYDCYFFAFASPQREEYRAAFLKGFDKAQPTLVVLTDQFCFEGHRNFDKVAMWPELENKLLNFYTRDEEWTSPTAQRWWARTERPTSYRVYVRR